MPPRDVEPQDAVPRNAGRDKRRMPAHDVETSASGTPAQTGKPAHHPGPVLARPIETYEKNLGSLQSRPTTGALWSRPTPTTCTFSGRCGKPRPPDPAAHSPARHHATDWAKTRRWRARPPGTEPPPRERGPPDVRVWPGCAPPSCPRRPRWHTAPQREAPPRPERPRPDARRAATPAVPQPSPPPRARGRPAGRRARPYHGCANVPGGAKKSGRESGEGGPPEQRRGPGADSDRPRPASSGHASRRRAPGPGGRWGDAGERNADPLQGEGGGRPVPSSRAARRCRPVLSLPAGALPALSGARG